MLGFLSSLILIAAACVLLYVVRVDFLTLKVRNRAVLVLLLLYAVWSVLTGFESLSRDILAGAVLFAIALVMWLVRAMGAGDVKLYAALGPLVGFDRLLPYVILLLLVSCLFLVVISLADRAGQGVIGQRLREIRASGKAPYAVPMGLAAIPVILLRAFA